MGSNNYTNPVLVWAVAASLLAVFFIISWSSISNKSITFDETAHITSGYSYWEREDFRLNPQNGLFPQLWLTLPIGDHIFPDEDDAAWQSADIWRLGDQFLHQQKNDSVLILKQARTMNIVLGMVLGIIVFLWSRKLWGDYGALFSLSLYCLSPLIMAHTRLATSDMAASLGFVITLFAIWKLINESRMANILMAGGALGLLALSKMSVVIAGPLIVLLVMMRYFYHGKDSGSASISTAGGPIDVSRVVMGLIAAVLVSIVLIWIPHLLADTGYGFDWSMLDRANIFVASILTAFRQLGFLPESYLYGLAYVLSYSSDRLVYAAGHFSVGGFWWFFPYAILVKTPLVTLACFMVLPYLLLKQNKTRLYDISPIVIFVLLYLLIAMTSGLNIGLRHLMPLYPLFFILCGVLLYQYTPRKGLLCLFVVSVLLLENLTVYPHYISYFNAASGGPSNGHRMLVDSSLDWGQDLPAVQSWLQDRDIHENQTYLAYFGTERPENYDIKARNLPGFLSLDREVDTQQLTAGVYIISATLLRLVYQPPDLFGPWTAQKELEYQKLSRLVSQSADHTLINENNHHRYRRYESLRFAKLCDYLRNREPDDMIAHSFLVYRLSEGDLGKALGTSSVGRDINKLTY